MIQDAARKGQRKRKRLSEAAGKRISTIRSSIAVSRGGSRNFSSFDAILLSSQYVADGDDAGITLRATCRSFALE